ncbi:ArsR/SmtB family transcription factor [Deinococcus pimensis]|uniref:ArsR/SmtB family transcription factor n=1 Tax=Deinococcus pimensis TaxID=309888 RepID=UPI0012FC2080|nr:hypothetical protein [Deinococcus pimensis]
MSSDLPFCVTDGRASAFLVDPALRRYFYPFLNHERTVAEVARELGETSNAVLYRVRRMCDLGLLRVARTLPRRGRAVKVYTSVAERVFVPYARTPLADLGEALRRSRLQHEEVLISGLLAVMRGEQADADWGLLLYREGETVYAYDALEGRAPWNPTGPREPALLDYAFTVNALPFERAKALQRDLLEVLAKYFSGEEATSGSPYAVRIALTPLPITNGE